MRGVTVKVSLDEATSPYSEFPPNPWFLAFRAFAVLRCHFADSFMFHGGLSAPSQILSVASAPS